MCCRNLEVTILDFRDIICELYSQISLTLIKDMVVPTRPYAPLINNIYPLRREIGMLCSLIPYVEKTLVLAIWHAKLHALLSNELKVIPTCPFSLLGLC